MEQQGIRNMEALAIGTAYTEFGKIPPQAIEFEKAVLGAILIEDKAIYLVGIKLKPYHFYSEAHRWIYSAICNLFIMDRPIDLLTVSEELKQIGKLETVGGSYYISQLQNEIGSAANLEYHSYVIIQKWIARAVISQGSGMINSAYEDSCDVFELLKDSQEGLIEIQQSVNYGKKKTVRNLLESLDQDLTEKKMKTPEERMIVGLSTGIAKLTKVILGWRKGNLIIVAGNTSEGKTTAAVQGIVENCKNNIPVAMFSLEMTAEEMIQKIVSMESGVDLEKIITGEMDANEWSRVYQAIDRVAKYKLYIEDTAGLDILEIVSIAKMYKMKYDIDLIVIDYLQLINLSYTNQTKRIQTREQEISFISRRLKELAKELDVPLVALSQLSRANEKRAKSEVRPQLSDLRDGGSIEQDADVVVFVFRPEKHGLKEYPGGASTKNITEFIVAKARMLKPSTVYAKFLGHIGMFDSRKHEEIKSDIHGSDDKPAVQAKKDNGGQTNIDDDVPF